MRIYLDTNIIKSLGYFRNTKGRNFLKISKFLSLEVFIPSIVIDEVLGNFKKDLEEVSNQINKSKKKLSNLTDTLLIENLDIEEELENYSNWFHKKIHECHISIIDYPSTSIEKLIKDSYRNIKPFKISGEGYKDYLIWESIKEDIDKNLIKYQYCFVTSNKSDFFEEKNNEILLHNDLKDQLPHNTYIDVYESYDDLFKDLISPQLENIDIDSVSTLTKERIEGVCTEYIYDELIDYSTHGFDGLYFSDGVSIFDIETTSYSDLSIQKISENELSISLYGEMSCGVHGFIDKSTYWGHHEEISNKISVVDPHHNNHVMMVEQYDDIPIELNLTYSIEEDEITNKSFKLPTEMDNYYLYM